MRISYLPATLWTVALAVTELALGGTVWAAMAGLGVMALLGAQIDGVCAKRGHDHSRDSQEDSGK
ncbi:MAG: hypothetical protein M0Q49_01750 [Porticoccaceae bacterium]|nr:hypothetical protein [Porticoccaceae bacterium]